MWVMNVEHVPGKACLNVQPGPLIQGGLLQQYCVQISQNTLFINLKISLNSDYLSVRCGIV